MNSLIAWLLIGFSSLAMAVEPCPRFEGKFPTAVVDLGEDKLFYFTSSSSIYSEQGQSATVYLLTGGKVIDSDSAKGRSDWFSFTEYIGAKSEFSCDSVTLDFQSAWFVNENGERKAFTKGEVRAPGYTGHNLSCTDGW